MRIWSLWGLRRDFEDDPPELMVAWDGMSAEQNFEGWEAACKEAKDEWGEDLVAWRLIEFDVSTGALLRAFDPPVVSAEVAAPATEGRRDG